MLRNSGNRILEDLRKDFRGFWDLEIRKANTSYEKTYFDEVNTSLIFERLAESGSRDDLAFVLPSDPTIIPLVIIESLLCLLKIDSFNRPNDFLDQLKAGDNVFVLPFSGGRTMKPGIFDGIESKNGKKGYRVKDPTDKTSTTWYPEETKWRIKPYSSQDIDKRKRSAVATGEKLEEIMGLSPGDLFGMQSSKGIIVTGNKGKLKEEIKEITIGGDPIESIFPIADFSDADTPKPLLADPLRREYVLGLVSNSDTAVDICFKDPSYKLVIIDGASKVRASYGNITRLNADNSPRKVICLLSSSDEEEIETLKSMGIDCWVWKSSDFQHIDVEGKIANQSSSDFEYHNEVLSFISQSNKDVLTIHDDHLDQQLTKLSELLSKLYKGTPESDDGGILLRRFFSYLKFYTQVPVTIKEYERYCFNKGLQLFTDRIDDFENDIITSFGVVFPRDVQKYARDSIVLIKQLYSYLENKNPKYTAIKELLTDKSYGDTSIVCSRPDFVEILQKDNSISQSVDVVTLNSLRLEPKGRVIFTGFFTKKFQSKLFLAPFLQCEFILYGNETLWYNNLVNKHPASSLSKIDSEIRKQYFPNMEQPVTPSKPDEEDVQSTEFEEILNSVNKKFGNRIDITSTYSPNFVPSDELTSAHRVTFEDDSFTFINGDHHLTKLDRLEGEVIKATYEKLQLDDEIVFTDTSRNLFEDLLADIKSSGKYSHIEDLSSIWWKSLNHYATVNNLTSEDIANQLELVGCKRHPVTIREWMKGERFRPGKIESTLAAIAKIVNDPNLNDKMEEIIKACKDLHSIHIQVGRLLVKRIASSVFDYAEDSDLDKDTQEKIEAYADRAHVKVIMSLSQTLENVPMNSIGQLFTIGDQL